MNYHEIEKRLVELFEDKKGLAGGSTVTPFPQPFRVTGPARKHSTTGDTVFECEPLDCAPLIPGDDGFSFYIFKLSDVEAYEKENPEVKWEIIDSYLMEPIPDSLPALMLKDILIGVNSPFSFVKYLRECGRGAFLLEGLTPDEEARFYGPECPLTGWGTIEEAVAMLPKISINRFDFFGHLKAHAGPTEINALGQADEATKARLAEAVAECLAKQKQLESELARERDARIKAEEAARGKASLEGQLGKAKKTLERWQGALTWMIPAAVKVGQDGPKARKKTELWPFVIDAGGPQKRNENDEQFKAWRAALPDDFCDKRNRAAYPPVTDEPLDE